VVAAAAADDIPLYLDPAPIYPVTVEVVVVVLAALVALVLLNAAAVVGAGEPDVVAAVVGAAAAGLLEEERVGVVVAEERREDTVADNSVRLDLLAEILLVNAEEDIGSCCLDAGAVLNIQQAASCKQHLKQAVAGLDRSNTVDVDR
jgi:hypothetical protein